MVIITKALDPTHRIAFGTAEQAHKFIAAAIDPTAWLDPVEAEESLSPPVAVIPPTRA